MSITNIIQIIISIALIAVILLQSKSSGLGKAWGGDSSFHHTKRGAEKLLFYLTIALAILFFIISMLNFVQS